MASFNNEWSHSKMDHSKTLPETGYVRLPDILRVMPVGKSTWWAGVKSGRFPKSVKLGPRITAWRVEDIRALIESFNP
jgi:prophage regulatory protein